MLIESLLSIINIMMNFVLNLIPNLPDLPESITSSVFGFIDLIFDNVGLLGVFAPLSVIKILVPLWLAIEAFDHTYSLIFWVVRKIPILNIRE